MDVWEHSPNESFAHIVCATHLNGQDFSFFFYGSFAWSEQGEKVCVTSKSASFWICVLKENSQLSVCDQLSLALLHRHSQKNMSAHTTCLTHIHVREAPTSMTLKWRHGDTATCSLMYTSIHIHTTEPEECWGWWQSLSLCWCQSLQRKQAEWHRVASGDTQPVITKWHKWPTFLHSQPFPIVSTCSNFVYLVLFTSNSILDVSWFSYIHTRAYVYE